MQRSPRFDRFLTPSYVILVLSISVLAFHGLALQAQSQRFLYVSNFDPSSNSISGFLVDSTTGLLTPLPGFPVPVGTHPYGIAVHPNNKFLYVTNEYDGNISNISAFSINPSSGALTQIFGSPFATAPGANRISFSASGQFVYVNSFHDNAVSAFSVDGITGSLTPLPGSPFPAQGVTGRDEPGDIEIDPTGKFLFTPNYRSNSVTVYNVDPTTGALTFVPGSPFSTPPTGGLAFETTDPTGRFFYLNDGYQSTVDAWTISSTGKLTPIAGSPFSTGPQGSYPTTVKVDRNGHFAYVTNEGGNSIAIYKIDPTSGDLTPVSGSPFSTGAASGPTAFTFSPDGMLAYVANQQAGSISVYSIDAATGALTPVQGGTFPTGTQPVSIAIVNGGLPPVISPTHGGNTGSVTVTVLGQFSSTSPTAAILRGSGQPDILGSSPVLAPDGFLLTSFDLRGAEPGLRDFLITQDGTSVLSLPSAFTVDQGGSAQLTITILGPSKLRVGRETPFDIIVGNTGNIDADYVVVQGIGLEPLPEALVSQKNRTLSPTAGGRDVMSVNGPLVLSSVAGAFGALGPGQVGRIAGTATLSGLICSSVVGNAQDNQRLVACTLLKEQAAFIRRQFASNKTSVQSIEGRIKVLGCDVNPRADPSCPALLARRSALLQQRIKIVSDYLRICDELARLCGIDCPPIDSSSASSTAANTRSASEPASQLPLHCCSLAKSNTPAAAGSQALVSASTTDQTVNASVTICGVKSLDPNDKFGTQGIGKLRYTSGQQAFSYTVAFENSQTATAPAQTVVVNDPIDLTTLDLESVMLGPLSVQGQVVTPPTIPLSVAPFNTNIDLRPAINLLVQISASLNRATSTVTWSFSSLDPSTGLPPTDPAAGFLAPGADGSVSFSVTPVKKFATGTVIQNTASIVFDLNAPIATPTWVNTIDNTPPLSHVAALPTDEPSLNFGVSWTGTDVGAGIQDYTIYASDNGAPFAPWLTTTSSTSASFTGKSGHHYGFYSIARDLVGNVEAPKTRAEATTTISVPADVTSGMQITSSGFLYSRATHTFNGTIKVTNISSAAVAGPLQVGLSSLPTGITLANATTSNGGIPFITLPSGLAQGQSVSFSVQFSDPSNVSITYKPIVYSGAF